MSSLLLLHLPQNSKWDLNQNSYNASPNLSFLPNSSRSSQKKPSFFHLTFCPILRSVLNFLKKCFPIFESIIQILHKKGSLGTLAFIQQATIFPSFFLAFQVDYLFPFSLFCNTKSLGLVCFHRVSAWRKLWGS